MEEQNTTVPPEYQKRFNEGYTIAKYMPELAAATHGSDERQVNPSNGFQDGRPSVLQRTGQRQTSRLAQRQPSQPKHRNRSPIKTKTGTLNRSPDGYSLLEQRWL
jgi:hypothetical protein